MPADRDISHLFPAFATLYARVLSDLQEFLSVHYPGTTCKLIEGFRTAAYQHELFLKHPRVTWKDGYKQKSNHQSSMAADVGLFKDGAYIEEPKQEIMDYYGHCCRVHGLTWGGDWNSFKDDPHCEWPTSDRAQYGKARVWQIKNNLG